MKISSIHLSPSPISGVWFDINIETSTGTYHAQGKKFADGSKYGINGGRVSLLMITHPKGYTCLSYDRGSWYRHENNTAEVAQVLNTITDHFDHPTQSKSE